MSHLIESTRFVMLLATLALLCVSVATVLWGVIKMVKTITLMIGSRGDAPLITLHLIQLIDAFLISIILYLFAVSIYELFIGGLDLPSWMIAHNLQELKEKLSGAIVLVMAVRFVECMVKSPPTVELLYLGLAAAVIASVLIAFSYFGGKELLNQAACPVPERWK